MSDDQHGESTPQQGGQGGWERLPQGDYDDGATTFVQLPEGASTRCSPPTARWPRPATAMCRRR